MLAVLASSSLAVAAALDAADFITFNDCSHCSEVKLSSSKPALESEFPIAVSMLNSSSFLVCSCSLLSILITFSVAFKHLFSSFLSPVIGAKTMC